MIDKMNHYGKHKIPFIFIIDFDKKKPIVKEISSLDKNSILYNINGVKNTTNENVINNIKEEIVFKKYPISFKKYKEAFQIVNQNQYDGNSYLLNLTFPTKIETNLTLEEIYFKSLAKYKLFLKDKFVVFSPETFIKINNNKIYSYPMKGTIDATILNAKEKILNDDKEFAEHLTIVDLIRNDLSRVAKNIEVEKFRYIEKIKTHNSELYQVSSEISGELEVDYNNRIGDIIYSLLPAGSVTGAPKNKTVEIIKEAEKYNRDYYTGIFGIFDGKSLDSAVMIRFIENNNGEFYFKSGGGITIYSDVEKEYKELIDKVYVPIN